MTITCSRRMITRTSKGGGRRRSVLAAATAAAAALILVGTTEIDAYSNRIVSRRSSSRTIATTSTSAPLLSMVESKPPLCSSQQDEAEESFELHVGRALDTLRSDYSQILTENPDYSIYDARIELVDPSGVKIHGLRNYQAAYQLMHWIVKVVYCPAKSSISHRMCFDKARQNIRIHWNVEVVPREIFGGSRTTAHIDGISVYELDRVSGNITQHRIENLLLNGESFLPKEGVLARLRQQQSAVTVPSFIQDETNTVVNFQLLPAGGSRPPSSLFALEASGGDAGSSNSKSSSEEHKYPDLDWDAYESKNKSRKKFGLKDLTIEEFLELQETVKQMAAAAQQQQQSATAVPKKPTKPNFLEKMLGGLTENTCESNFDCERPEICCDFGFQKRCCSSGTPVGRYERQLAPVPVVIPGTGYPNGQGPGDTPRNY